MANSLRIMSFHKWIYIMYISCSLPFKNQTNVRYPISRYCSGYIYNHLCAVPGMLLDLQEHLSSLCFEGVLETLILTFYSCIYEDLSPG